jgi:hypothetical protein
MTKIVVSFINKFIKYLRNVQYLNLLFILKNIMGSQ